MKTALCLAGRIGSTLGKKQAASDDVDVTTCYKYITRYIIEPNNCDVFLHTWSVKHADLLCELYRPVEAIFQEQINFISAEERPTNVIFNTRSKWYSIYKVFALAIAHDTYDLIMISRYDLLPLRLFDFTQFSRRHITLPPLATNPGQPRWKPPLKKNKSLTRTWLHDLFLIGGPKALKKLLYNQPRDWYLHCSANPHKALYERVRTSLEEPLQVCQFFGWRGYDYDLYRWRICHSLK
jgi:hypothetical protein